MDKRSWGKPGCPTDTILVADGKLLLFLIETHI